MRIITPEKVFDDLFQKWKTTGIVWYQMPFNLIIASDILVLLHEKLKNDKVVIPEHLMKPMLKLLEQ